MRTFQCPPVLSCHQVSCSLLSLLPAIPEAAKIMVYFAASFHPDPRSYSLPDCRRRWPTDWGDVDSSLTAAEGSPGAVDKSCWVDQQSPCLGGSPASTVHDGTFHSHHPLSHSFFTAEPVFLLTISVTRAPLCLFSSSCSPTPQEDSIASVHPQWRNERRPFVHRPRSAWQNFPPFPGPSPPPAPLLGRPMQRSDESLRLPSPLGLVGREDSLVLCLRATALASCSGLRRPPPPRSPLGWGERGVFIPPLLCLPLPRTVDKETKHCSCHRSLSRPLQSLACLHLKP
eukprot:GGOE01024918.1.p1 GENE.GGOE01024918.1~~GGOE01024918.1.p1  ORF type:complete len:286 (+),score=3.87 GGOE01024918.1:395-1252(+)